MKHKDQMPALALHGGAEPDRSCDYKHEIDHMDQTIEQGYKALKSGKSALETVLWIITELENSGLYLAGKGAAPNRLGIYELDAGIMDGCTQKAGSVCALENFANPAQIAYEIMNHTPHVMLAAKGAAQFANSRGYQAVSSPDAYFTPSVMTDQDTETLSIGTVGAVALDLEGNLAAVTSTAGVINKLPGRIGDSPLIGSGLWADQTIAISTTGQGEYFIQTALAHQLAARLRFAQQNLDQAAMEALMEMHYVKFLNQKASGKPPIKPMDSIFPNGGKGGLIAVDREGKVVMPYIGSGMKRASINGLKQKIVSVFE